MKMVCGNCRQFERAKDKPVDLCGAWGNPTTPTRAACEFWTLKLTHSDKQRMEQAKQPD